MLPATGFRIYRWTDESATVLRDALEARFPLAAERAWRVTTTWADTFDGRLHAAGWSLSLDEGPSGAILRVRDRDGRALLRAPGASIPAFAAESASARCRELLAPVAGIRRLLHRIRRRTERQGLRVLDPETKTVVRLILESGQVAAFDGEADDEAGVPWPTSLKVRAVRGYEPWFDDVCDWIEESFPSATVGERDLEVAFRLLGLRPGADGRPRVELDPEENAGTSLRRILAAQLAVVRTQEDGVRRDLDPEFLHDLRVAVRRTRSLLGQVRDVLPEAATKDLQAELKWLQRATGPLRDLDVQLLELPRDRLELPERRRGDLDPLEAYLRRHRAEELRTLRSALDSARYEGMVAAWRDLAESVPESSDGGRSQDPIARVAAHRVRRAWKKILKEGRRIGPATEAAALHRLRIDGKKLRYLLELFAGLWSQEALATLVKPLKKLQDNLGAFQDCEVQQERLLEIARGMVAEGDVPPETLLALGRLASHLERRQRRERRRFAELFRRFDTAARRKDLESLLGGAA